MDAILSERTATQMELRPYQTKVIEETHKKRESYKRILIIAGTGAGKTVIGSKLISDFVTKGQQVIFLVHRDILIKQTLKKLEGVKLPYGIIAGSYPEKLRSTSTNRLNPNLIETRNTMVTK